MHFINKNGIKKSGKSGIKRLYGGKNVRPKRDHGLMNVGSLLGVLIYSNKQILIFQYHYFIG